MVFAATGLTWREGQELCENLGGHLAESKSEEQNTFLVSLAMLEENLIHTESWQIGELWSLVLFYNIPIRYSSLFSVTGLSDQGHEGRWIWQHSVEDVEFESWASGQPEGIVS